VVTVSTTPTVVEQTPVTPDPSTVAATDFASQGDAEFKAGNYDAAIKAWQHALVDDPQNGALVLLIGQALFAQGKYDEAAGAVQQGMQLLPEEHWNVVVAHYEELYGASGTYASQLRALEAAADKADGPALRFLLGYHYGYLGYPKEAVRELDKTLKLAPQDEVAAKLRSQFAAKLPPGSVPAAAPAPANPPVPAVPKS
jgi:tetratricopeptide (TPR) repeat protein